MHDDRELGIGLDRSGDEMAQEWLAGIFARAGGALQDHRAVRLARSLHDRLDLLHVVDVERRHAVAVLGGMIEKLAQGNERHQIFLLSIQRITDDRRRAIALRTASATRSGVKPKWVNKAGAGADSPKRSMPITAPPQQA